MKKEIYKTYGDNKKVPVPGMDYISLVSRHYLFLTYLIN